MDLDVHQGNGTAEIFRNNKSVFTISFHGEKNYPFRKEKSDFDHGFLDGTSDNEYLKKIIIDVMLKGEFDKWKEIKKLMKEIFCQLCLLNAFYFFSMIS